MLSLFLSKEEKAQLAEKRKICSLDAQRQALMQQREAINVQMADVTAQLDELRGTNG